MYHVGKVVKILSPENKEVEAADNSIQALVDMWDENLLTLDVDAKLSKAVREGDIVVVDYHPVSPRFPAPRMVVTKILHGDVAEKTWREYKEYFEKMKKRLPSPITPPQVPPGYR